jgi:sarcosine oxidase subunit gamma
VASLLVRSPAQGLLPIAHGSAILSEEVPQAITGIAPLAGCAFAIPAPNGVVALEGGGRMLWSGLGQALILGPAPTAVPHAAVTDQSDAWAVLRLEGMGAGAVLVRLTPLDLRASAFPPGTCARSLLGHVHALFEREGTDAWRILVPRSMTGSVVHDLTEAMRGVAARSAL